MKTTLIAAAFFVAVLSMSLTVNAATPQTMNYQGHLKTTAGAPFNGLRKIIFRIYDVATGGAPLWTETSPPVAIAKGQFSVTLGAGNPAVPLTLAFDKPYWIGITVDGDTTEMTPRQPLTTAPYAFRAGVAESVSSGSQIVSTLPTGTPPLVVASTTTVTNLNADMVDGRHAADFVLKTGDTMSSTLNISGSGNMWSANNWQKGLTMNQAGVLLWNKGATGFARGIGTSDNGTLYIARSAANDTSQPPVYDLVVTTDGNTGIGMYPTNTARLEVGGEIKMSGAGNGVAFPDGSRLATGKSDCMGSRYEDNGNGTISDCRTGLVWLKNANCTATSASISKVNGYLYWQEAVTWTSGLQNGICGLTDGSVGYDWRLPTKVELMAMVESARKQGFTNPALTNGAGSAKWVQGDLFNDIKMASDQYYWSATTYAPSSTIAWVLGMSSGLPDISYKTSSISYVWPVRAGQ